MRGEACAIGGLCCARSFLDVLELADDIAEGVALPAANVTVIAVAVVGHQEGATGLYTRRLLPARRRPRHFVRGAVPMIVRMLLHVPDLLPLLGKQAGLPCAARARARYVSAS